MQLLPKLSIMASKEADSRCGVRSVLDRQEEELITFNSEDDRNYNSNYTLCIEPLFFRTREVSWI